MNCEHVEELLSLYLDNVLATVDRQVVATHLHSCPSCTNVLADFQRFDMLIAQLPRVAPPPSLHESIFSSSTLSIPKSTLPLYWPLLLLLTCLGLLTLLTLFFRKSRLHF